MPRRRSWPPGAKLHDAPIEADSDGDGDVDTGAGATPFVPPTLLQPRVAVVLGVPTPWHRPLFACRLLSVVPAVLFGLPPALRLLGQLHAQFTSGIHARDFAVGDGSKSRLIETLLAIIWSPLVVENSLLSAQYVQCGASSYLSFFFTDCLMSRWLLNYTPQATIVRLLAVNALNCYLTSWVLHLVGSPEDPGLLLPAWIAIATILTAIYHTTQRKINIRKETSISISVFSLASFISMLCLLAKVHIDRPDAYPPSPVATLLGNALGYLPVPTLQRLLRQ